MEFRSSQCALLTILGVCATGTGRAQNLLYDLKPDSPAVQFGAAAAGAGDVNADGFPDFIVGMPTESTVALRAGAARVYSGRNGSILYTFYGVAQYDEFGRSADGAGDVNADGYADLIVGAGRTLADRATVFSGKDGTVLHTFAGWGPYDFYGASVAGAGDVNGDGFDDVLIGAPQNEVYHQGGGYVQLRSGQDGSLLHYWNGCNPNCGFGTSVESAGDVDADGHPDVMVYTNASSGIGCGPGMDVYSGATGALLYHKFVSQLLSAGPRMSSGAGDVNGDGFADFITGNVPGSSCGGNLQGKAQVFSGLDGVKLYEFEGVPGCTWFGWSVAHAGDLNRDGVSDVIIGAIGGDYAEVYSGQSGALLFHVDGPGVDFGWSVDGLGDVNGDGYGEFIAGSLFGDHARVYSACPGKIEEYGSGCAGSGGFVPHFAVTGCPFPGGEVTLHITGGFGGQLATVMIGTVRANATLPNGCSLLISSPTRTRVPFILSGSGAGKGSAQITYKVSSHLPIGTVFTFQAQLGDPGASGGFTMSNGVELTLQ